MNRWFIVVPTALLLALSAPAFATGDSSDEPKDEEPPKEKILQGCTPGYWKNHTDAWTPFDPAWDYDDLGQFELPPSLYGLMHEDTLLDILKYKGGSGYDGAARILLRHAMAALLNNQHPDVRYPLGRTEFVPMVNEALASLDREEMLQVKAVLEFLNEQGCPL